MISKGHGILLISPRLFLSCINGPGYLGIIGISSRLLGGFCLLLCPFGLLFASADLQNTMCAYMCAYTLGRVEGTSRWQALAATCLSEMPQSGHPTFRTS